MPKPKRSPIPEELFHAIATLVARFIFVTQEECGVTPMELLTLWHIRHVGERYEDDQTIVLRQELTRMLTEKFNYTAPDVTRLLTGLKDKGFISRGAITAKERVTIWGSPGSTQVIILKLSGKQKIEEFKTLLRTRGEEWLGRTPSVRAAVWALRPVAENFARWLVRRYEPKRQQLLQSLAHQKK